ncbi:hypothetical protein EES37_37750 [Streptomyces sp. ADI91-18]|uniref:hypothetical protein n=1 Tax=Streptomyces sp. ADI91-18 TaxID=1522755 RepID=UPI000F54DA05|nr:hypothetical protein [Streptomyces sp. ADI91-18]RPK23973.1 hypothetical protein EES37_37750 [Streptomyces sp. ADI91-18]
MPWNSKPPQSDDDNSENEGAPLNQGEGHSTARVTLLAAVGQAILVQLAGETGHWLAQSLEWLANQL